MRETLTFWTERASCRASGSIEGRTARQMKNDFSQGQAQHKERSSLFLYHSPIPSCRALSVAPIPSPGGGAQRRAWQRPAAWLSRSCRGPRPSGHGSFMSFDGGHLEDRLCSSTLSQLDRRQDCCAAFVSGPEIWGIGGIVRSDESFVPSDLYVGGSCLRWLYGSGREPAASSSMSWMRRTAPWAALARVGATRRVSSTMPTPSCWPRSSRAPQGNSTPGAWLTPSFSRLSRAPGRIQDYRTCRSPRGSGIPTALSDTVSSSNNDR